MAVPYPSGLPTALRASKRRSQAAPFRATPPAAGKLYVQRSGADTPVVWSLEFRFSRAQALAFREWFETDLQRGILAFDFPIRTEFGVVVHTCRFSPYGLLSCREDGETFTYSATVLARAQVIPAGYLDAAELIFGLPGWATWAALLDETVTEALPE